MMNFRTLWQLLSSCVFVAALAGCGGSPPATGAACFDCVRHDGTARGYSVLHSFAGPDGLNPQAALLDVNGTLYGTAVSGGYDGEGTVYSITRLGTQTVLHSFGADDGADPEASLINFKGTLYGTTVGKGAKGAGTVFSITLSGTEAVLHSFQGPPTDGAYPLAALVNVGGTFYGTTSQGGAGRCFRTHYNAGCGTVFSITPAGTQMVVYSFKGAPKHGHGGFPYAGLIQAAGRLYGTTESGGANDEGTVFSITPAGTETVLHSFGGAGDGEHPEAGLVNVNGTLYGTTTKGGANDDGTVFLMTPSGTEKVLHSFGGSGDGVQPQAGLVNMKGTLYGTTFEGGKYLCGSQVACGTVFAMTRLGKETVLHSFSGGTDGARPAAALINVKGTLYGTTEQGGTDNGGTVFSLTP